MASIALSLKHILMLSLLDFFFFFFSVFGCFRSDFSGNRLLEDCMQKAYQGGISGTTARPWEQIGERVKQPLCSHTGA